MARVFVRQTFGLGGEQETINDGPNQLGGKQDISRITVTAGKFAVTDAFNGNAYANDPRTTFLNWNIYGGGSYDWTMDKLSWTWGAFVDFNQKNWAFRTGYFLLPTTSNAKIFDTHIPERGQYTAELELRYSLFSQPGKLRLFGWVNNGMMGGYTDALALPLASPQLSRHNADAPHAEPTTVSSLTSSRRSPPISAYSRGEVESRKDRTHRMDRLHREVSVSERC